MYIAIAILALVLGFTLLWFTWRKRSHQTLLPCPSELAWMVEIENPLARNTRSAQIVNQLRLLPGMRVMDIGCGPGRVTIPVAQALQPSGLAIALDVQPEMLAKVTAKAQRLGLGNLQYVLAPQLDEMVPDQSLDAAFLCMALGEIPAAAQILSHARQKLKTGGHLLISESIFDPHYVRRSQVENQTLSRGFVKIEVCGNFFGYNLLLQKS